MDTLLPVIVGGIIGLAGGLIGPPLAHWLNEGAAKKRKRAEKLEELIGALYAFDHWLGLVRSMRVFGTEGAEPPSPLAIAQAIAVVYFPDLDAPLAELESAARIHEQWMLLAGQKRLGGDKEFGRDFDETYKPYRTKFIEIVGSLKRLGKTEFAD